MSVIFDKIFKIVITFIVERNTGTQKHSPGISNESIQVGDQNVAKDMR